MDVVFYAVAKAGIIFKVRKQINLFKFIYIVYITGPSRLFFVSQ